MKRALWAGVVVVAVAGCDGSGAPAGSFEAIRDVGFRAFPGSKVKVFRATLDACVEMDMYVISVDPPYVVNAIAPGRVAGEKVLVNISFLGSQNLTRVSFYNIRGGSDQASVLRTRIFDAIAQKLGRGRPRPPGGRL